MTFAIVLQFLVVLAAIWMGARSSGIGLGLWGAVGLLVLVAAFGINPTSPPIDVMLIILAVVMASAGGDGSGRRHGIPHRRRWTDNSRNASGAFAVVALRVCYLSSPSAPAPAACFIPCCR